MERIGMHLGRKCVFNLRNIAAEDNEAAALGNLMHS